MEINRIEVPFPKEFGSGAATNAYLLRGDRTVLIDSGVDGVENRAHIKKALQDLGAWGPDVILVTHGHHDHFGLSAYIQGETGSKIMVPEADSLALRDYWAFTKAWFEEIYELGVEGGFDRIELDEANVLLSMAADFIPKPSGFSAFRGLDLVLDGIPVRSIPLPGHTMGSTGYAVGRAVFSGDAALEGRANVVNLTEEFTSLQRLKEFESVYAGHGKTPLARADIERVEAHFTARTDQLLRMTVEGRILKEIVQELHDTITERNFVRRLIPVKQTIAYLRYLERRGRMTKRGNKWFSI
ncbi:MAG: MBL fold metallo-hydrolase [Candidatus Verstraetearchaeota archaeon]|nr:MBL fold metallo-hydrolase [Candidatus Verstraetearchaeota archaeon]